MEKPKRHNKAKKGQHSKLHQELPIENRAEEKEILKPGKKIILADRVTYKKK